MPHLVDHIVAACPVSEVAGALAHQPADWLEAFLRIAAHEGETRAGRYGITSGASAPPARRHEVRLSVGEVSVDADGASARPARRREVRMSVGEVSGAADGATEVVVPFTWLAEGYELLFHSLTGRIVLTPLGACSTRVAIEGSYEVPAAAAHPTLEALVRHAAEHTVRNLLLNLRTAFEELERIERGIGTDAL